jgi:hypothetical protein
MPSTCATLNLNRTEGSNKQCVEFIDFSSLRQRNVEILENLATAGRMNREDFPWCLLRISGTNDFEILGPACDRAMKERLIFFQVALAGV